MLQVILGILKILLWIILAILGLLLLLILLVLFSPIKYKIDAKYHGAAVINAKISFLIATVRVMFEQDSKRLDYSVRLAGIKLNLDKEKKTKRSKKSRTKKYSESQIIDEQTQELAEASEESQIMDKDSAQDGEAFSDVDNGTEQVLIEKTDEKPDVEGAGQFEEFDDIEEFDLFDDDIDKDVPKEQQSLIGRIKAFFVGLKSKLISLRDKLQKFSPENIEQNIESKLGKLKKNIERFKKFWNLKCTVKTRNYLKKYIVSIIKHIGPRSVKGYVRYGFGDPCKTGQVTGYLSLLPFVYSKHFSLEPDFYEKIIDAELLIKGRIRLGYIIRIVLNINVWRTIIVAKKIFKGKKREV